MAITISGSGITSANIADGTITTDDILASDVKNLKSGRKNLIINGGMDVWQRGTTGAIVGSGYATADRWRGNLYSNGTVLLEKKTDATGQDFTTYARLQQSVAGTVSQQQGIIQIVEGTHAVGKTVTVSFKARASKTLTACQVRGAVPLNTYDLTTDWQTFSFTGTGAAIGSNTWLMFDFGLENDTWYVDLAEVQLELGSVATDFEHRSYGEELALCQRYYQKSYTDGVYAGTNTTAGILITTGSTEGGSSSYQYHTYPVPMRAAASITFYNSSGASGVWQGNSSPSSSATRTVVLGYSGTAGFYFHVVLVNTWVVCQVFGHFTADAEL